MDKGGVLDPFDPQVFHDKLTTANGIKAWWHYLECAYIIKVSHEVTAQNVCEYIMAIAPKKLFFTCELNIGNHNGYLPKEAWDWIDNNK